MHSWKNFLETAREWLFEPQGGFFRLWSGINEVLWKGGQFGDTFFEGRGDAGVFKAREPKGANVRLTG
jgi:hypothetical protein